MHAVDRPEMAANRVEGSHSALYGANAGHGFAAIPGCLARLCLCSGGRKVSLMLVSNCLRVWAYTMLIAQLTSSARSTENNREIANNTWLLQFWFELYCNSYLAY